MKYFIYNQLEKDIWEESYDSLESARQHFIRIVVNDGIIPTNVDYFIMEVDNDSARRVLGVEYVCLTPEIEDPEHQEWEAFFVYPDGSKESFYIRTEEEFEQRICNRCSFRGECRLASKDYPKTLLCCSYSLFKTEGKIYE